MAKHVAPSAESALQTQILGPAPVSDPGKDNREHSPKGSQKHGPLNAAPLPHKKKLSRGARITIGAVLAVVVVVFAVLGILTTRNAMSDKEKSDAIDVCEKAQAKYSKAHENLKQAIESAAKLHSVPADQVADANTLSTLSRALGDARNLASVGGCSASLSETILRAHARDMSKQLNDITDKASALHSATSAVEASKTAFAVNQSQASLQGAIDDAQILLDNSQWQVADASTLDALSVAIDEAQKLIDAKSTDIKAMQDAVESLSSASEAVNASVAAQNAANANAQANAGLSANNTGNAYTNSNLNGYSNGGSPSDAAADSDSDAPPSTTDDKGDKGDKKPDGSKSDTPKPPPPPPGSDGTDTSTPPKP